MQSRREFLKYGGFAGSALFASTVIYSCKHENSKVPFWLIDRKEEYLMNPRQTALNWFRQAGFGMFVHYGLYSLLGRQEWVQFTEKIPVKKYEMLKSDFTAKYFDADFITDLLLTANMKYLNLTVKHHDSFCLWDSQYSDFKSTNTPAKRDLLAEIADQCSKKGIALFLNYSYGRDWRHPHAPNCDNYKSFSTRPAYNPPDPHYKYGTEHDLSLYVEFGYNQIKELLSNYGDIAGIYLGGSSTVLSGQVEPFQLLRLYEMIRNQQAQTLITNGRGVTGTEDYLSSLRKTVEFEKLNKTIEISDTLQPIGWGYDKGDDGKHKNALQVIELLKIAKGSKNNLLLNTGPLPDGRIHPEDIKTLKQVGKIVSETVFPD